VLYSIAVVTPVIASRDPLYTTLGAGARAGILTFSGVEADAVVVAFMRTWYICAVGFISTCRTPSVPGIGLNSPVLPMRYSIALLSTPTIRPSPVIALNLTVDAAGARCRGSSSILADSDATPPATALKRTNSVTAFDVAEGIRFDKLNVSPRMDVHDVPLMLYCKAPLSTPAIPSLSSDVKYVTIARESPDIITKE
jgi:hypothetical protein